MALCGYRTGVIQDPSRPNWDNTGDRPIAWSAWYPTDDEGPPTPAAGAVFDLGAVIRNAALAKGAKLPVVLLSHGTGGTAESLGWLARHLARQGCVVLGVNHHGNTGIEPHMAAGFLCWWERATDLSMLLTASSTTGFFAGRLDLDQISAVGFSLGGHTVLALAGARSSMTIFDNWQRASGIVEAAPREFPDLAAHIPDLQRHSVAFRHSWARHGADYTDKRIRSVVAMAPAPPVRSFTPTSISAVAVPVAILTGGADREAPWDCCAGWLLSRNTRFRCHDLGPQVGHYTFLERPSDPAMSGKVDIFSDHESLDRGALHEKAAEVVVQALRQSLS